MTSNDLVPVFTGTLQDQSTQLCNARDLHAFLVVGDRLDQWIARRIAEYGFTDGEDYCTVLCNRSDGRAGKRRTDYHLSLDMAKELSMIENNEQGRAVRRYFIRCEKAAHLQKIPGNATAKSLPAPDPLSDNLRQRINKKAHALSLEQFDTLHELVRGMVEGNLKCGASEADCEDYIERFGSHMGGATLVNTHELRQLTFATTAAINAAGAALAVVHRLEAQTGLELYARQIPNLPLPELLTEQVLKQIDRLQGVAA